MTKNKIMKALESDDIMTLDKIIQHDDIELPNEFLNKKVYAKYKNNKYYNCLFGFYIYKLSKKCDNESLIILCFYHFYKSLELEVSKEIFKKFYSKYTEDFAKKLIDYFDKAEIEYIKNISPSNEHSLILNKVSDDLNKILTDE